ncbi:MAG: transcriptional repressor, partial [Dehalococcoidia bacterium]|nr:transcriptional repressor [Dehalococcoidia bacterium]
RTVKSLSESGVVDTLAHHRGETCYRLCGDGHHHHLVCRSCGRVEDFATCDVSSLVEQLARSTEYEIEGHWLEVYGQCASCRILQRAEVKV